jgi:flagellar M-ring protein FliF
MPAPHSLLPQLREVWSRLQASQRLSLVLLAAATLGGLGTLVYFMNRVEYQEIFRDLSPEDAQAITAKLKEERRDFLVEGEGTIKVAGSKADADKLRVEIAGSGLARSGKVGFEIFDKSPFGMTDFAEQVNYNRALEGELARTISSLAEISTARVHLVLPKESLFEERKEEAKASVVVRLRRGSELSRTHVSGIVNLVAAAVPGLQPFNISVVDWEGNPLSQPVQSGDSRRPGGESGFRAQLEKELVQKVLSILEPVVGKGRVHANASLELEAKSAEQTEESFNPTPPAVVSQQKSEERSGPAKGPTGVPGANPAAPSAAAAVTAGPERTRQSEVTNYEVSKVVRHTVEPQGRVKRLSIAVLLDHKAVHTKGPDGKVKTVAQPRPAKELESYRELVLAAVGYDKARGDVVTLEDVPFFNEVVPEEDPPKIAWYVRSQQYTGPAMKYTAFLALFLLAYFMLFRPLRNRVFALAAAPALGAAAAGALPGGAASGAGSDAGRPPEQLGAGAGRAEPPALGEPDPTSMSDEEIEASLAEIDAQLEREFLSEAKLAELGSRKHAMLRRRLTDRAKREPEQVSQLLRAWLQEKEA